MNDCINRIRMILLVITFVLGMILGCVWSISYDYRHVEEISSDQFGGVLPMKIYQVYDKDTGVYYAVTEKGGICVMQTMAGETKLVEQGEPPIIHKNKGE